MSPWIQKLRIRKIRVIVVSVALVCALHYLTPLRQHFYHELFSRLYYLPIFLGGFWFGLWGGLRVSMLVTLVYLPHVYMAWGQDVALFYGKLLEVVLFNLAGPVVGALADRERRQRARNQELETLAALGEAASSVAHEMKNMVIPIRGFVRRIRETNSLNGKGSQYLEIVERESARLEAMTQDMLAFARHAPLRREEVDVALLLEDVWQGLHEEFHDNGIRLTFHPQGENGRAPLDRERVRQGLVNLLQNALHASGEGKEVRLLARREQDSLRFVVEDEGEGIPEEHLNRIVQPFFTTKPKGTGLGLAITQGIVQEHGGEMRVESTPGKGTRVTLEFPIPGAAGPPVDTSLGAEK